MPSKKDKNLRKKNLALLLVLGALVAVLFVVGAVRIQIGS